MVAAADAASAVDALDRLVRVVRADADGRHQLAVRAAFVGALARSHPEVVRAPGGKRSWTPAALAALAAATTSLLESKHELHCVVGVDDFAMNVSYKKKSLVYLRAELAPALRVLTYASLPAASGEANRGAHVREDDETNTATETHEKEKDVTNTSSVAVFPDRLLQSAGKASAARAAALNALDDAAARLASNDATDASDKKKQKEEKERRAVALSHALRLSLQASFPDAHWHVAHDWRANPLGVAPATSTTSAVVFADDDFAFVAWRHASRPPGFFDALGLVAADRDTLTLARRSFLVVVLAYAMWFNSMCDLDGSAKMHPNPHHESKKSFGDAPLRSAEDPLTATLCAAAPRAAPFALVALTLMGGNYAMGLARRVAAHAAGRNGRKSKKA